MGLTKILGLRCLVKRTPDSVLHRATAAGGIENLRLKMLSETGTGFCLA